MTKKTTNIWGGGGRCGGWGCEGGFPPDQINKCSAGMHIKLRADEVQKESDFLMQGLCRQSMPPNYLYSCPNGIHS